MFLIFDKNTKEVLRCHGQNSFFSGQPIKDLKKDLHLKSNEDFVHLTNEIIIELKGPAYNIH